MAGLKSLAKDTAIYGMSSIVGRFLNYLLVPLYTAKAVCRIGWLRGDYQYLLLCCTVARHSHIRHGNVVFPVCQQEG